jgi:tetratricopeptide (TPR) repeat protein
MVVAAIFFFAGLASQRKSHLANVKFLLALPLLVAMMMLPAANLDIPVLGKWARTISAHTAQTEEVRLEVLSRGWRAVALRPVLGSGPGAFGLSYQTVRSPQRDQNEFINLAHNDYIEMAVETGVVGFILWLWLFLAAGGLLWKRLKTGRQPVQAAGVLGALVALGTFSVFNFIVSERPIFWLQFLVLGLALSFPSSRQRTVELKVVRYGSSLLLLGLGLWATQFGWQSLRADTFVTQADENSRNLQLEEASRNLDRAIALQPYRAGLYQKRADVSLRLAALSDDQRHELACVYYLGKAREASPKNIAVLIQLSDAYGRLQDFPRQAEVLQAAAQIAPGHAAIVERTAAASIRSGQLQGAVKVLEPLALRKGGAPLQQLAALTLALERQKTGQGLAVAQRVVQTAAPERAKEYFDLVASSCEAQRYWAFAGQIAELRLGSAPDDFCLHRQLATAVGQKEGKAAEFALLDKAVRSVDTIEQPCAQEVLARWVELGLGRGQASAMSSHLAQLGASHERTPWLSIPRSEVFLHQGRVAEAALVLNHGLEISPYSYELLMQAGKVQEAAGHQDLALNSYRQALDSRPGDGPAQQGIDRLLQR